MKIFKLCLLTAVASLHPLAPACGPELEGPPLPEIVYPQSYDLAHPLYPGSWRVDFAPGGQSLSFTNAHFGIESARYALYANGTVGIHHRGAKFDRIDARRARELIRFAYSEILDQEACLRTLTYLAAESPRLAENRAPCTFAREPRRFDPARARLSSARLTRVDCGH